MNKKILLISPLEDFLINPKFFPPLGILYLSSYLKQHYYEVDVIHGDIKDIKKDYDFYGISSSTPQYPKAKKILEHIKINNPKAKVILGGAHVNSEKCALEALIDGFDYVVRGTGEKSLLKIVEGEENRKLIVGERLTQEELDNLLPDRDAINIEEYGYPIGDKKAITIITSRGCPYRCSFCSISCGRVDFRDYKKVIEEIFLLKKRYGYENFMFLDDSFTVNKKRLKNILEGLKDQSIRYRCYARADNSSEESLLKLMLKTGCVELGVGIESGSQKILDLVDKKTSVKDNLKFLELARKIGIRINSFIMIGLPGEDIESVNDTREFMEKTKPEAFGYNIFTPMPDSPIVVNYEKKIEYGPYKGKSFKDFITIYPMPYEKAVTKAKKIEECFVSTPALSREDILRIYNEEFERFIEITGFDPRKRDKKIIS